MSPRQLLAALSKKDFAPAYLFLGPDAYTRRSAREELLRAHGGELTRHDLDETSLAGVVDDASSLSLFASERVIWVSSAEGALPKRLTADLPPSPLDGYLKNPTPGTVVVLDCSRYGFEGDDKPKLDRVRKFYAKVPAVVEFLPLGEADAAKLARDLAAERGLKLTPRQVDAIVEALGADAGRIDVEIEKLALFAGGRALTDAEVAAMIPNARTAGMFTLVNALASGNRARALDLLDTLVREGEYLPLALTFLGTQFRLALAAAEGGAKTASQIETYFREWSVPMWRSRAEQVADTLASFGRARIEKAILWTAEADRALRDTRPDDRTVIEEYVWKLTARD